MAADSSRLEAIDYTPGIRALDAGRLEEAIHLFKDLIRRQAEVFGGASGARDAINAKMQEGEDGMNLAIEQQQKNFYIRMQRSTIRLARAILLSLTGGDPGAYCKGSHEDASTSTELRPDDIKGRINRANVLIFSARYARDTGKDVRRVFELALADLDRALKIQVGHPTALHNRGIIFFYLANLDKKAGRDPVENYEKAIQDLKSASEMDPGYSYIFKDLGVCRVALARVKLERGERPRDLLQLAVGDLTMAVDINGRLYGAFYERGMGFFSLKQFDMAISDWEKCLNLDASKARHLTPLIQEAKEKLARQS